MQQGAELSLRPLTAADLGELLALQSRCYGADYLESRASFEAKLAATEGRSTCWMAWRDREALAYAVALPVTEQTLPALNAPLCERVPKPELLYLHDIAVSPEARSLGLAGRLLACLAERAQDLGLSRLALIAVQGSVPYWTRQGFEPWPAQGALALKLASFGVEARLMQRRLRPAAAQ
ncbi:MAG: GNAT family N-acetyltransferase [Roseateles depolymerans]|uniref:GNAT family N-acetyltransferase n=1 Tax=Roseateles depolymerans TaxID=76731 RepID=A0A2W5G3R5_9BURK|nr:MAG: GNAT family N-acetyltransferase [Roseateles depolymerans]